MGHQLNKEKPKHGQKRQWSVGSTLRPVLALSEGRSNKDISMMLNRLLAQRNTEDIK